MATKKKTGDEVATTPKGGQLAMPFDYGDMAGEGMEAMTSDDSAIPFLSILQAQSPQIVKDDRLVEGAKPGMFINSIDDSLMSEFIFVPCATDHLFVEWRPRNQGGGMVQRHDLNSGIMSKTKKGGQNGKKDVLDNGNEIVETFYVVGFYMSDPDQEVPDGMAILAFTSSGITKYKKSIGELRKFSNKTPLFAHRLRVGTVQQSNAEGTWYNYEITPANQPEGDNTFRNGIVASLIKPGGPQQAILEAARELAKDYRSGTAKVADESPQSGDGGAKF